MMNPKQEIKVLAADLDIEEEGGPYLCPFCRGGGSGEKKLYLRRLRNVVLYKCHRASCPAVQGGAVAQYRAINKEMGRAEGRAQRVFDKPLLNLPRSVAQFLRGEYGVEPHDYGMRWTGERVYIPVRDYYGRDIGCTLRFYPRSVIAPYCRLPRHALSYRESLRPGEPKTDTYRYARHGPFGSWYPVPPTGCRSVVLVEDQISAIKLHSMGQASIALIGVHMSTLLACEVAKVYDHVIVALDPDATSEARKLCNKHRLLFRQCTLLPLTDKDIKDMNTNEIYELRKRLWEACWGES